MSNETPKEIVITQVGLQAQWTDSGRRFSQLAGYSQSGAVDRLSFQLANALCGNPLNSPCIEVMGGDFSFHINAYCLISITGAKADIRVNKQLVELNQTLLLRPNDNISIGRPRVGLFNYVSFAAIFTLPLFKNSICAVKREKVGGINGDGSSLLKGEHFVFDNYNKCNQATLFNLFDDNALAIPQVPFIQSIIYKQFTSPKQLPIVFSYQHTSFTKTEKRRFLGNTYTVTTKLDKMGVRLDGPRICCQSPVLRSQPMTNGAVQIPGDGKPIIMRSDRQTIGGYPIIGVVNSVGLAVLSQASAYENLCFTLTNIEASIITRRFIEFQLNRVLNRVKSVLADT